MNIPVLMYHGISDDVSKVPYGFLLQSVDQFEACMRYLVQKGFTTITLQELYDHLKSNTPLPHKSIVLTFDDGYLDNWVYVYPILKKYRLKGTIFVVPDFVDPTDGCRPNLDDAAAKRASTKELKWWGYLSWAEMKKMEADGVMDIQSHTLSHTWYFSSDKLVDFHHPNDSYPWLAWNEFPERKYKWVEEPQEELVGYGAPIYEYGRSLGIKRYFDDRGLRDHLVEFVSVKGGKTFFTLPNWRKLLGEQVNSYKKTFPDTGRYETDEEYQQRLRSEIIESKRILEANLEKQVNFLCWPGGAHTPEAYTLAMNSGYLATTKGDKENAFGNDPTRFHRIATYLDSHHYGVSFLKIVSLPLFVLEIQRYRGYRLPAFLMQTAANLVRTSRAITKLSKTNLFLQPGSHNNFRPASTEKA
jgi:hypothetical protein